MEKVDMETMLKIEVNVGGAGNIRETMEKIEKERGRPAHVAIQNFILTPKQMENISYGDRMSWRINNIINEVMHKLFLAFNGDVIVVKGSHSDLSAFNIVGEALLAAGWVSAISRGQIHMGTVLVVSNSPEAIEAAFGEELGIEEGPMERTTSKTTRDSIAGAERAMEEAKREHAEAAARSAEGSEQDNGRADEAVERQGSDALVP